MRILTNRKYHGVASKISNCWLHISWQIVYIDREEQRPENGTLWYPCFNIQKKIRLTNTLFLSCILLLSSFKRSPGIPISSIWIKVPCAKLYQKALWSQRKQSLLSLIIWDNQKPCEFYSYLYLFIFHSRFVVRVSGSKIYIDHR